MPINLKLPNKCDAQCGGESQQEEDDEGNDEKTIAKKVRSLKMVTGRCID